MKLKNLCLQLALTFMISNLSATILYVPSQYTTIQAAINNSVNGDTILVSDGTYSGAGNYNIEFFGKKILLQSVSGANNTIIDCMNNGRGFNFQTNEDSTAILDGFKIINANAPGDWGGGISCFWSSPLIRNCIMTSNNAERGGGIAFRNSNSIMRNCIINNNNAEWGGGVHISYSSVVIENSEIVYNNTNATGSSAGIAAYLTSNLILNKCIISNNDGEGIAINGSTDVILNNCYIQDNIGDGLNITNFCDVNITNCIISGNLEDGIYASTTGPINIINSNLVYNTNHGIYTLNSNFSIKNSILYGNSNKQIYMWTAPLPSIEYTDIQNRLNGGIVGAINWGAGNLDVNPDFVDANAKNYRLIPGSQCNGAGTLNGAPSIDLDNNQRPLPSGSNPDIGAYEINQGSTSAAELGDDPLNFYPNPFNLELIIQNPDNKEIEIIITDVSSRMLFKQNSSNSLLINTQHLAKGIYFLELRKENGVVFKSKVVKN